MNKIIQWVKALYNLRLIIEKVVELIEEHKTKIDELIEDHKSALRQIAQAKLELQAVEDAIIKPSIPRKPSAVDEAMDVTGDDIGLI